jgi:hypothetical protein
MKAQRGTLDITLTNYRLPVTNLLQSLGVMIWPEGMDCSAPMLLCAPAGAQRPANIVAENKLPARNPIQAFRFIKSFSGHGSIHDSNPRLSS